MTEKQAPSLKGYSRFLRAEFGVAGRSSDFLEVKLTDDFAWLKTLDVSTLRDITSSEFLTRYLETQEITGTPENIEVLRSLMPAWQIRSLVLEKNERMNANYNRFAYLDVPDVRENTREHTRPTKILEHRSRLSLATLNSLKDGKREKEVFVQSSTGPLSSVRGRLAPGLNEQKQEKWQTATAAGGAGGKGVPPPAERLGQNETTLEDAFLCHMYPFSAVEEMKLPIRFYLPKADTDDLFRKHAATGSHKRITFSPTAESNPSTSARQYYGLPPRIPSQDPVDDASYSDAYKPATGMSVLAGLFDRTPAVSGDLRASPPPPAHRALSSPIPADFVGRSSSPTALPDAETSAESAPTFMPAAADPASPVARIKFQEDPPELLELQNRRRSSMITSAPPPCAPSQGTVSRIVSGSGLPLRKTSETSNAGTTSAAETYSASGRHALQRRPSIAAFMAQEEALALTDDRQPGPAQRVEDLPLSALRELATDFKVKHSVVVQFMTGFVADLRDWHRTLSAYVQKKELTIEQIDIVGRELTNERVYSLSMLILQWIYLTFMYHHCEEATKEIRRQSFTNPYASRSELFASLANESSNSLPRSRTSSISVRPISRHDNSFKIPVSSKLDLSPAEEIRNDFNASRECEDLLHKILVEFGLLSSEFRHHKSLGKQGTLLLLPLWLTATRGLVDSILSRTYSAFSKSVMGRHILHQMQERITHTFDPHGFLAETPLLRSHPVAIRIMRTMAWKVRKPTWHHMADTSPLVRAALLRPRAPEALPATSKPDASASKAAMAASRPTLPRETSQFPGATGRRSSDGWESETSTAEEEKLKGRDAGRGAAKHGGTQRHPSPPPSPGHRIHPTQLEGRRAEGLQRVRRPEHQQDLLKVAWQTARRSHKYPVPSDYVKARLPEDRGGWLQRGPL